MGALSDYILGKEGYNEQVPLYTNDQQSGINTALQRALSGMQNSSPDFSGIENKARSDFSNKTIPSILNRFAGGGYSSSLEQALGEAGTGLDTNLASMGSDYNLRVQQLLQQLLGTGLTQQFQNQYHQSTPGILTSTLPGLIDTGAQMGAAYLGGPAGAAAYGGAKKAVGSAIGAGRNAGGTAPSPLGMQQLVKPQQFSHLQAMRSMYPQVGY